MSFFNEDIDSLCLSKTYFDNIVFHEINLQHSNILNNCDSDKIYMLRIWIRWSNKYVYKIGTTKNLKKRVKDINHEYDSCGRIIIIACGVITSNAVEKFFHNNLKEYRINNVTIPIKSKKREIYHINDNLYDNFMSLLQRKSNNIIFESEDYVIDNNIEHIISYEEHKKYFSKIMNEKIEINDNHILLDKYLDELRYWNSIRKNC
jgi:hypothetical protein